MNADQIIRLAVVIVALLLFIALMWPLVDFYRRNNWDFKKKIPLSYWRKRSEKMRRDK